MRLWTFPNVKERILCLISSFIFLVSSVTAFISQSQVMGMGIYKNYYARTTSWKENRIFYYDETLWQNTKPYHYDIPPWERIEDVLLPPPEPQPFVDILDIPPPLRQVPRGTSLFDILKIMPPLEDLLARRIAFSETKPEFVPDIPNRLRRSKSDPYAIFKRQIPLYVRACPEDQKWVRIKTGINLDNTEVEVSQRQWFWRTTCKNITTQGCLGFKRDDGLQSECRETNSWMIAWAKLPNEMDYRWHHIAIPTCCSCAVPVLSTDFS